jgi:hypothetical protein
VHNAQDKSARADVTWIAEFLPDLRRMRLSRRGDSRKIAGNYRWRADADGNFPQVENGLRDEPQHRGPSRYTALLRRVKKFHKLF